RKARRISRRTTSPVTRVCSASTCRNTSAESPRVAKALTRTLVSRNTLTTRSGPRPHQSGILWPRQKVAPGDGAARNAGGLVGVAEPHEPGRFGFGLSGGTGDLEVSRERGRGEL